MMNISYMAWVHRMMEEGLTMAALYVALFIMPLILALFIG